MPDKSREFMSPADLAELLDVPLGSVRKWRKEGIDPPAVRVGKHVRYRRRDVEDWIKAHTSNYR